MIRLSGLARWRTVAGVVVLGGAFAVLAPAAPAGAQSTGAATFVNCATTSYRLLFWPKGHKAIKSQSFPAYATPHAELYSGTGKTYAENQYLGYIDATGASNVAPSCTPGTLTASNGGAIPAARMKTTTKPTALTCTIPSSSVLIVPNAQGKAVLSVVIAGESPTYASMAPTGSELNYDSSMCERGKVPKK